MATPPNQPVVLSSELHQSLCGRHIADFESHDSKPLQPAYTVMRQGESESAQLRETRRASQESGFVDRDQGDCARMTEHGRRPGLV